VHLVNVPIDGLRRCRLFPGRTKMRIIEFGNEWRGVMTERNAAGLIDPGPIEFKAVLERDEQAGASGYVQFPIDPKKTYGKGNLVPIRATFDGAVEYRGGLANMGGEHAVLIVLKDILARLGKNPGDMIDVRIVLDTEPRIVELDDDEREAIDANVGARDT